MPVIPATLEADQENYGLRLAWAKTLHDPHLNQ
jgi:hypothetical protein